VLSDEIKEGKLLRFYGGYRGGFVVLHEATVNDHIGAEDCTELAAKAFLFQADPSLVRRFGNERDKSGKKLNWRGVDRSAQQSQDLVQARWNGRDTTC